MTRIIKEYLKKFFVVIAVILFCLLMLELGLRVEGRVPTNVCEGEYEPFEGTYRLRKNFVKVHRWPGYSYTIYTNEFGFRDNRIGKRNLNNKPYAVFLGDSMTFGIGVDYEETFVGIFHELAMEHNGVEVLNMAVPGHVFSDQEKLFMHFMKHVVSKPSYVLICTNDDFLFKFQRSTRNLFIKDGYLLSKKNRHLAYIRKILSNRSSAYFTLRNDFKLFKGMYFNHGGQGMDSFFEVYSKNYEEKYFKRSTILLNEFEEFEEYCSRSGIVLIYLYIPRADSLKFKRYLELSGKDPADYDPEYYENLIRKHCLSKEIAFISLRNLLKKQVEQRKELRFRTDGHFNKFANKVIGEYIFNELVGKGLFHQSAI